MTNGTGSLFPFDQRLSFAEKNSELQAWNGRVACIHVGYLRVNDCKLGNPVTGLVEPRAGFVGTPEPLLGHGQKEPVGCVFDLIAAGDGVKALDGLFITSGAVKERPKGRQVRPVSW